MSWLEENPDIKAIRIAASDLNGVARGKRIPARFADKIEEDGTRFPLSVLNLDIWGEDIDDSPLVFEAGDPDGVARPTERGFLPMPWLHTPTGLLPAWMFREDAAPLRAIRAKPSALYCDAMLNGGSRPSSERSWNSTLWMIAAAICDLSLHRAPGNAAPALKSCPFGPLMPSMISSQPFMTGPTRWISLPKPQSRKQARASLKSTSLTALR